jgi:riboflavin kinase/FMN adenylyltransferase
MLILKRLQAFGQQRPGSVAALGVFDGLHLGHRAIIAKLLDLARRRSHDSVVVTFDPPPQAVLMNKNWPGYLTSLEEKEAILEGLGLDVLAVIRFTPRVAQLSPREFVARIFVEQLRVSHVVCGRDCGFGKGRSGNLSLLRSLGREYGFAVTEVRPCKYGGQKISSSLVRNLILAGQVDRAAAMLGRPYSLAGKVVVGRGLGRRLGFPTINFEPDSWHRIIPRSGVYAAEAVMEGGLYPGLLYVGTRPTLGLDEKRCLEFHALKSKPPAVDEIRVRLLKIIRPEQRFPSLESLRQAMGHDAEQALRILEKVKPSLATAQGRAQKNGP